MALTPKLDSPSRLFGKLERELVRAFHHKNPTHKSDHFYNFCITAHSIRDYLLEHLGKLADADTQPFHEAWSKNAVLVAVGEIANTAKHFQLRKRDKSLKILKTKGVRGGKTTVAEVYVNGRGQLLVKKQSNVSTYVIKVKGGKSFELYAFMDEVVNYWKKELKTHGVRIRNQSNTQLHGT